MKDKVRRKLNARVLSVLMARYRIAAPFTARPSIEIAEARTQ